MMERTAEPVQRHRLAWLADGAWAQILAESAWDAQALAGLVYWRAQRLPLVVARQPHGGRELTGMAMPQRVHLGLAMPNRWGRGRLSIAVNRMDVAAWGRFPLIEEVAALLPPAAVQAWQTLSAALRQQGCMARVYGSFGWQWLSGLDYVRAGSDLDVLLPVHDAAQADRVVACLSAWPQEPPGIPQLDGELLLPDHSAVQWREWGRWRQGMAKAVLVKRLDAVQLHTQPWWRSAGAQPSAATSRLGKVI